MTCIGSEGERAARAGGRAGGETQVLLPPPPLPLLLLPPSPECISFTPLWVAHGIPLKTPLYIPYLKPQTLYP